MTLADYTVRVTQHAHEQYYARVAPIEKDALQKLLTEQIGSSDYHRKSEYLKLDGVWWVFEIRLGVIIFITSYGRTHVDIPSALRWAHHHKDRINLTGGEVLCDDSEGVNAEG